LHDELEGTKWSVFCSENQHVFIPFALDTFWVFSTGGCEYFEKSSKSYA
jgi:hypothetical protein